jgi:predicted metal-dependent phosphoesterase TrpH
MKVKASLHTHSGADRTEGEAIGYSVFELLDTAKRADIKVLAHTCHQYFVWDEAWRIYAESLGILLIPGVELVINEGGSRNHIVAINCDDSISAVQSFADLQKYRQEHPDLLLIAAHPNFGLGESLGMERLEKYWYLFDAVENSWFYTRQFNLNTKAQSLAQQKNKPYIATADLHNFNFFCLSTDYAILDLPELTVSAVITAVRQGTFANVTAPKSWPVLIKAGLQALTMGQRLRLTKWLKRFSISA